MTIITQNEQDERFFNTISTFFKTFKIGELLRRCNACKQKGVSTLDIFKYKLCNVFSDRNMYMQMKTDTYKESFPQNTYYRFLDSAKTNWLRFTTLLSKKLIDSLEPLTSEERIMHSSLMIAFSKEPVARILSLQPKYLTTVTGGIKKGFRLLSLLWTDGSTAVPINSRLLSSTQDRNVLCKEKKFDGRSLAGRRRKLSRMNGTKAMIELISRSKSAGIKADYVLFDTWFSSPAQLCDIKKLNLDTIAMVRKSSKIRYTYDGEKLNLNKIYGMCKNSTGAANTFFLSMLKYEMMI